MRNFSMDRSNLSDEKIAFLSELKENNKADKNDNTPHTYKRPADDSGNDKELDILWEGFKTFKDEKSPGMYLTIGFIAGALCVFVLNSILNISSDNFSDENPASASIGQPKFEKKISRKEKMPQINTRPETEEITEPFTPAQEVITEAPAPETQTYTVKSGDSMSSIVINFFGRYDTDKIEKIKEANNLASVNKLKIGQELIIPMD